MTDMRHLTADELVDLVERVVAEGDVPHLATCGTCRQHVAELRATLAMASEVEMPDPSPLFWDHFSSRVREAVATEGEPRPGSWPRLWSWPGVMAPISAVAASVVMLALVFSAPGPAPATPPVATVAV